MSGFLLDTNVVSEPMRPRPETAVVRWLAAHSPAELFLASITVGELVQGVHRLSRADARERYDHWIHAELIRQFEGHVLPFDQHAAVIWGEIMGSGLRSGRPLPALDAQLAAIARQHGLKVATRNLRHFRGMRVALFDPWTGCEEAP